MGVEYSGLQGGICGAIALSLISQERFLDALRTLYGLARFDGGQWVI